ncbi:hypothetical protein DaAHT2_1012 [Desulfurivibrio alkaliphilus AHT 2]|uniref:Uncharacterized protein n=1 Tax=Desulfurivibrio alkaliphilus (strain DSM 19089 / UNIQEM U267 / AHT2) TaxID=589865 RepID=D6Z2D7_DESAT|nr:hypothetical protein DaAHT2_1012 [Desulfurivibrio alkaliphilus AHT 2]
MFIGTLIILTIGQMSLSQQCLYINFRLDILCHPPLPTQRAKNYNNASSLLLHIDKLT